MSDTKFWNSTYTTFKAYRDAHIITLKQKNYEMWLQGQYFLNALSVVIGNGFGGSHERYIDEPIDAYPDTEYDARFAKSEAERQRQIDALVAWGDMLKLQWDMSHREGNNG